MTVVAFGFGRYAHSQYLMEQWFYAVPFPYGLHIMLDEKGFVW
jgi:hypothetical protein